MSALCSFSLFSFSLSLTHKQSRSLFTIVSEQKPVRGLTWDVGGDLRQRRLAEPFGCARPHRHQVGGSRMEAGEHVVGLVP